MTSTTRRTLLRAGALGLAIGPMLLGPDVFAAFTTRRDLYTRARFTALRRRSFQLQGPRGGSWRLRLVEVHDLAHAAHRDRDSFSLVFRSGADGPPQGTYLFTRRGFTPTSLFVVPVDDGGQMYEAVVYRKPRRAAAG